MTRGFVTIATGNEKYYRIAANLLHSYRLFSADPMPFALICDRENEYSKDFDLTIHLDAPWCSYLDKLYLPDLIPYDETIFLDADCLAYRDLNDFWIAFENSTDFSVFGKDYPTDYPYAWFKLQDTCEFSNSIESIPDFIGGVYFLRKGPHLQALSETCRYILKNYHRFKFRQFTEPADEPIYALAMSIHGDKTAGDHSLPVCFYLHTTIFKADILSGSMCYDNIYSQNKGLQYNAYMVHWCTGSTKKPVYLLEEYKLNCLLKGKTPGKNAILWAGARIWLQFQAGRVLRKLRRVFHIQ